MHNDEITEELKKDYALVDLGYTLILRIGITPSGWTLWGKCWSFSCYAIRAWFFYLMVALLLENPTSPIIFVDFLEGAATITQGSLKSAFFLYYFHRFLELYSEIRHFWVSQDTPEIVQDYKTLIRFLNSYRIMVLATLVSFIGSSVIDHEPILRMKVPDIPFGFWIILAANIFLFFWDVLCVIGIDIVFLALCFVLRKQCTTIVDRLMDIDTKFKNVESLKSIHYNELFFETRRCIIHNKFVLAYTKKFIDLYRMILFSQYFITIFSICVQFYGFSERDNLSGQIRSVVYGLGLLLQLILYCFPADETSFAIANLGLAFYKMQWYTKPKEYQKLLLLPIQRTQRTLHFKAGNMFIINKESFIAICKTAFQIYTALKTFKDEED